MAALFSVTLLYREKSINKMELHEHGKLFETETYKTVSLMMWYRGNGGRAIAFAKTKNVFLLTQNRDGVGLFHWWGLI